MPNNDTGTIFETAIYSALVARSALVSLVGNNTVSGTPNVYFQVAPDRGANYPMVVFQSRLDGGTDLVTLSSNRVWTEDEWLVRAIGRRDDNASGAATSELPLLRQLAYEIDQALNRVGLTVADGQVLWSYRVRPYTPGPQTVLGVTYLNRGGIYRMTAK